MADNIIVPNVTNIERKNRSDIMVVGVGGAGSNAVNHMFNLGIEGVTFMICNTDRQALDNSPVPIKVQLGEGLGAGNDPSKGKNAALESLDAIMLRLEEEKTRMVFITAGMGGGTGTGAAPVVAKAARDRGILTVAITTLPLSVEGSKRVRQANEGLSELQRCVDCIVVIHNDNIAKMYGDLQLEEAFHKADDVLAKAAKGIAEIITRHRGINTDFADVKAVMLNSGFAFMSTGEADADDPDMVDTLVDKALSSPLLNHNNILGAKNVLCNLSYAPGVLTLDDLTTVLTKIQNKVGYGINEADINWGAGADPSLYNQITLTIVAVGFGENDSIQKSAPSEAAEAAKQGRQDGGWGAMGAPTAPAWSGKTTLGKKYDVDSLLSKPAFEKRGVRLTATTARPKNEALKQERTARPTSQDKELF